MPRRYVLIWTISAIAFVALTLWQVANVVRINKLLVVLEQKQHTLDSLQALVRQEQIAITRLESAERIRKIAQERLGLIEPTQSPLHVHIKRHED